MSAQTTPASDRLSLLFIAGIALIFVGIMLVVAASALNDGNDSVSSGIIIIGPFPIVIGAGSDTSWLIILCVIIAIISLITFIALRRL